MRDTEPIPGVSSGGEALLAISRADSNITGRFTKLKLYSLGLPQRLILFILLFAAEWSPITHLVHKGRGAGALLQIAIVFSLLLAALGYFRSKDSFEWISSQVKKTPIRWDLLICHLAALGAFLGLSTISTSSDLFSYAITALWYVAGL